MAERTYREHAGERQAYSFAQMLDDTGILWLINASVFHPRGLAMALDFADGEDQPRGWSLRSAPEGEPWSFPDDESTNSRFRAAEEVLAFAREHGIAPEQVTP